MKFWLTYLLTALVASAAIEVGVPILRTHVVLPPPAVDLTPEPVPVAPTGRTARVSSTAIAALVAEATTATPSPAAPTPSVVTTAGAAEMPGAADRQDLTGVAPAIADTGPATGTTPWGVTATHVSYYSQTGEHRGTLAGGVIVDILRHSNASRGEMAVCRIEPEGGAGAGFWLVALSDLVQFDQPRNDVPPATVALMKQYYGIQGQIDQRLADLKQQAAEANPYYPAYRDAAQRLNAFVAREKRLTSLRDQSSSSERMRLSDELRAMIPEGTRVQRDLDAAKPNYLEWKRTHGVVAAGDLDSDAQVRDLKQRLAPLEARVKEIVK